jgi:MFS family permease
MTTAVLRAPHPWGFGRRLWHRQLDTYPETAPRMFYLGIVVVATILLYYQLYVAGAVAPAILAHYNMSFRFYVNIIVVSNAVGAFSSLIAGLGDRWGRANMVTYGLLLTGLLVLFGIPNAPNELTFGILVSAVGFVEGIILVATPALVRDFSPQLGRASAMGFWTLGPVVGSLCVSEVSSRTLPHLHAWQDQFIICGITGLVIFVVALFGLRELSPALRDQLMVSMRDRKLIEAKAKGLDIARALKRPWKQMLHVDIAGSAFAIAVFLIIYYTAVGFFTIYFTSIFGFSLSQANGIGNWFWAFDAGALIVIGLLSDRVMVRKPFMVLGAVGAVVMTIVFLSRTSHPTTGYYTFAWIISVLAIFLAIAYAPWMASFTETVERRNPALTATGLAVWGWIVRAVVAISIFILPYVVSSATPLVDYGTQVQALSVQYASELQTIGALSPSTLHALQVNPNNPAAGLAAVGEVTKKLGVSPANAISRLHALSVASTQPGFKYLQAHGPAVLAAKSVTPNQWRHWWWVCVGGEVVFIPLIFLMTGRWRPRRARRDAEDHERKVRAELEALVGAT